MSFKKPLEDSQLQQQKISQSPESSSKPKAASITSPTELKQQPLEESKRTPNKDNNSTPGSSKRESFKKPEGRLSIETNESAKAS